MQLSKLRKQLLLDALKAQPQSEVLEVCGQLRANKDVTTIKIRNLTDSELIMILDSIPNHNVPSLIVLHKPELTPSGIFILVCLLRSSSEPVKCLTLHEADPTILVPLLQSLSAFPPSTIPHLEGLKMMETEITTQVAHEISTVLSKNRVLKTLEISSHLSARRRSTTIPRLDGPIAEILCTGLGFNKKLEILNLSGQSIGNQGAVALANALTVNNSLQRLDLQQNGIGNEGAIALAKAMQVNTCLQHLNLSQNVISGAGHVAFEDISTSNSQILVKLDELSWIGRIEFSFCRTISGTCG